MSKIYLKWHYRHQLVFSGDFKAKRGAYYATVMTVFLLKVAILDGGQGHWTQF
jgi:hypothetical protein